MGRRWKASCAPVVTPSAIFRSPGNCRPSAAGSPAVPVASSRCVTGASSSCLPAARSRPSPAPWRFRAFRLPLPVPTCVSCCWARKGASASSPRSRCASAAWPSRKTSMRCSCLTGSRHWRASAAWLRRACRCRCCAYPMPAKPGRNWPWLVIRNKSPGWRNTWPCAAPATASAC
ncbi:hypothetical protein D3C84_499040 [compost metagenome]